MSQLKRPILTLNLLVGLVSLVTIGCNSTTVSSVPASTPSSTPSSTRSSVRPEATKVDETKVDEAKVDGAKVDEAEVDDSPNDNPRIAKRSPKSTIAQTQPVLNGTGFMLPSKNIHCMFRTPSDRSSRMALQESFLRCEILSSLKPKPPRPKDGSCDNADWGSGLVLSYREKARVLCASDSVQSSDHPVLQYGQTWKNNGFTCESSPDGLTCSNPQGNGFSLNREEWQTF